MRSRRSFLAGSVTGALALALLPPAVATPTLTEDGLYHEPWFLQSLLELADDLDSAAAQGRRFAIIWELRGCPYCRQTHLVNFARPEIADFIKAGFDLLQLNIIGAREVVDFDGEKLSEKQLAQKYGVRATPTLQFFPEGSAGLAARKPRDREVARAQGYLEPEPFLAMFKFVAERAYERTSFPDYLRANGGLPVPALRQDPPQPTLR
jgi:thioredoxin-related protein